MDENRIKMYLDNLANTYAERDTLLLAKKELLDSVLTPEIKQKMADIEVEFSGKVETVNERITTQEKDIKEEVILHGASVKSEFLQAVYVKGREGGWDSGKLKGFAMAHPEILAAKKPDGEPSAQIRTV
jgi:hypothetical protein